MVQMKGCNLMSSLLLLLHRSSTGNSFVLCLHWSTGLHVFMEIPCFSRFIGLINIRHHLGYQYMPFTVVSSGAFPHRYFHSYFIHTRLCISITELYVISLGIDITQEISKKRDNFLDSPQNVGKSRLVSCLYVWDLDSPFCVYACMKCWSFPLGNNGGLPPSVWPVHWVQEIEANSWHWWDCRKDGIQ